MIKFGDYKNAKFDFSYKDKMYKIDFIDIITKNTEKGSNEINLVKEL